MMRDDSWMDTLHVNTNHDITNRETTHNVLT